MRSLQRAADLAVLIATLLAVWQGIQLVVGSTALASPWATFTYLAGFVTSPRFLESLVTTLNAFASALLLAYAIGLALGVWLGAHQLSGEVGEPILVAVYAMPKITLYPVVLLIFGLGINGKIAFGTMHGVLPVALLTMTAIRNIRPVHLKAARTMMLGRWQMVTHIFLPATLPEVVAGLRIGFTTTLLGVVLGEMFAAKRGLGFLMINAISSVQPEEMMSIVLVLFTLAAAGNALLLWIEHHLQHRAGS